MPDVHIKFETAGAVARRVAQGIRFLKTKGRQAELTPFFSW